MATKVVMEALSPTMEEGKLVKWLKNEGDAVKTGDTLAEVETDKAVMELVARGDGVLRKRLLGEGETAPVGQLLAVIAGADENVDALTGGGGGGGGQQPAPAAAKPQPGKGGSKAPEKVVAEGQEDAGETSVPENAEQSQGDASAPPQEKAPASAPAAKGQAKAVTDPSRVRQGAAATAPTGAAPPATDESKQGDGGRQRSSPLARRLASDRGLDLSQVSGSGPGGRIVKRDIESAAAQPAKGAAAATAAPRRAASDAEFEDVPLSQMRKTIAKRLVESIGPIPTFYLTMEIDVERVAEMRTAMAEMGDDFKVSFNDIILKSVATALTQHPECNAHWMGDRIRYFNSVHLGMAVAIPDGLMTPVIFDADRKSMREIAAEARDLAKRARDRKLKPDEYSGSTFTVSNLGMFGIDQFTGIINPPEAGLLAVGAVEEKPVVVNGEVRAGKRMKVTMSCDHRVIDGALGAKFLQTLRRMIENPLMLVF
jgi:pyruvate dehydrogenase E2 component (dihydrolipoamide acetyltransferase)